MKETKIIEILDRHDIAWSWFGDCVFVGNDRYEKIMKIKDELLSLNGFKLGFDRENNFIGYAG